MRYLFSLFALKLFAVFNLTWGNPSIPLDSNPPSGDTDKNAVIALDPKGNAVAVWSRTKASQATEGIWASIFNHSMRIWCGTFFLSGGTNAENPQLAMKKNGDALIVWQEGFPSQIHMRKLSAKGVWTPDLSLPPLLISPSENPQSFPQVGVDDEGGALLTWMEFCAGKHFIHSARLNPGDNWEMLGRISSGYLNASLIPGKALALNPSGQAAFIWREQNGHEEILGALFQNGRWSSPFLLSERGKTASHPAVAIDAKGKAIFVWEQAGNICSKAAISSGCIESLQTLSDPRFVSARPDVGVDKEGNAAVVFERYNPEQKFICGAVLEKGAGSWSTPSDISTPSPAEAIVAGYPRLSMNSIGDAVVIWKESTGKNIVIQGAGYSLGTWSFTRTLSNPKDNSGAKNPAYDIDVAVNDAGNILAIWPEDPTGNGSLQIKSTTGVGLANKGPKPPVILPQLIEEGVVVLEGGVLKGKQIIHRFPAHADLINILSWNIPEGAEKFHVYRNHLSSLIATTSEPYFEDHQRKPNEKTMYLVTSVDKNDQESAPVTLIVHPANTKHRK